jgi:hypothetical protein
LQALRAVEYELPSFDAAPCQTDLATAARAQVAIRHVRGASDASYLVHAFGDEPLMQLQLNVHRLVVVYRAPVLDALDAGTLSVRLECVRNQRAPDTSDISSVTSVRADVGARCQPVKQSCSPGDSAL